MPDTAPTGDRFWLLHGTVPTGPFSAAEIREKLASGGAAWGDKACPVGGAEWVPLVRVPGVGPTAGDADVAPPAPPEPASAGPRPPRKPAAALGVVSAAVLVALAVLWLVRSVADEVSDWVRPPTATEACKKFEAAKTPAEARPFTTPRMHPLLDALFADKTPLDPNDQYELTQEVDDPRPGVKRVGVRGSFFLPEEGRRARVEGYFVVVKSGGWKVDDLVFTGAEGVSLPAPVSVVEEHRRAAVAAPRRPGGYPPPPTIMPPLTANQTWFRRNLNWIAPLCGAALLGAGTAIREYLRGREQATGETNKGA